MFGSVKCLSLNSGVFSSARCSRLDVCLSAGRGAQNIKAKPQLDSRFEILYIPGNSVVRNTKTKTDKQTIDIDNSLIDAWMDGKIDRQMGRLIYR